MDPIRSEIKELRLGEKIRNLRQEQRLTLQELAELTGLSKPLLSQVENELVIPPLATLLKIAKGLRVGIHYFFEDAGDRRKLVLTRAEERSIARRRRDNADTDGYLYQSLAPGLRNKHMEPFLVEFELQEWNDRYFYAHDGEEFLYIVAGELEFHYGDDVYQLRPGDSIFYDSSEPHGYVSTGSINARAVAVLYSKD